MLVRVIVCPPRIVLVSVLRMIEVIGEDRKLVDVADTPPTVVAVTLVKVVVWPPEAIPVIVIVTLDVVGGIGLDRALVSNVEDVADVNDGVDTTILESPGMFEG
jgi:hypothetical protein